jgi:predicted ATPase/class 3 adenylate cyclase
MMAPVRCDLPSGTVTFLFTDVEGSTRLLHELGAEGYAAALAGHRRLVREAFAAHGGVEVDTQGDAFFVAFPDPAGAVAAAAEATEKLRLGPIRVRMALHTGSPHLSAEGYVGEDVHLGARIGAAGHGGQVLLSAATKAAVARNTVFLTDLGEHRLKDFGEPVAIFQLGSERFPPLKTISNTNLPRPVSSFVGREREVGEVVALVRNGARLVTLSGSGGSGKTRLSIEAAAELVGEFRAGVFWIGLASLRDPALVVETMAQTLGAKDALAGWIGERELLLVLDNLEQVIDAAPELASLLEACPNLALLVTSRELLRVRGEVDYPVLPLADLDAVELFTARANVDPDETVATLCRRLDNLPLALELAAARTAVLSPAQILDRLAQRLDLLKGGRDADPRQQTLRATIAWSHDLLDDDEKQLFARLAVFRGGCTLEAAGQVVGADLDVLQSLVDKSLVRHTGERFWLLETIREYAADQLDDDRFAAQHATYYLALAEEAHAHLVGTPKAWLDRLDVEHDNLRAALDRFETEGDLQRALELAGALHRFWYMRGHLREGRERLERLLAADDRPTAAHGRALNGAAVMAVNNADYEAARSLAQGALALHRDLGDEWGAAYSTLLLGSAASGDEDFETACRFTANAELRFRELGDEYYARLAAGNLGYYLQELGDLDGARKVLEDADRSARATQDERSEAQTSGQLGQVAILQGRFDDALRLLERSLRISSRLGDPTMAARDLRRLARVLGETGRPEAAACVLSASERMREDAGQQEGWIATVNQRILDLIRPLLEDDAFERAWTEGQTLTVEGALDLALPDSEHSEVVERAPE